MLHEIIKKHKKDENLSKETMEEIMMEKKLKIEITTVNIIEELKMPQNKTIAIISDGNSDLTSAEEEKVQAIIIEKEIDTTGGIFVYKDYLDVFQKIESDRIGTVIAFNLNGLKTINLENFINFEPENIFRFVSIEEDVDVEIWKKIDIELLKQLKNSLNIINVRKEVINRLAHTSS